MPILPTPIAVVLDTNLWGKGDLNLDQLRKHAERLAKSGIQVWVPHQVLLEWASHAAADAMAGEPIWKRLNRAGVLDSTFPGPTEVMSVVKAVEAKITAIPNVVLLPMTGAAAIAGIQDQILGTGPGEDRKGVKTGASDSSWVRDALAGVSDDASKLLFLTKNGKDVRATAQAVGIEHINICTEHALYSSLFGASAAPNVTSQLIALHLLDLIYDSASDPDPHPFPVESGLPIQDIALGGVELDNWDPIDWTDVRLQPGTTTIIGMVNVDIVTTPDPNADRHLQGQATVDTPGGSTVEFDLVVLTDLVATGYIIDHDGQVQSEFAYAARRSSKSSRRALAPDGWRATRVEV